MRLEILVMTANADAHEALTLSSYCGVISCTSIVALVYMCITSFGLHGLFEILLSLSLSLSLINILVTEECQLKSTDLAILSKL